MIQWHRGVKQQRNNMYAFMVVFFFVLTSAIDDVVVPVGGDGDDGLVDLKPSADDNTVVGPNNETCFKIWEFGKLQHRDKTTTVCHNEFRADCVVQTTKICVNVTEVWCKAAGRVDCKLEMIKKNLTNWKRVDKQFNETTCSQYSVTSHLNHSLSVCNNVTKLNCVGDWEISSDGSEKWMGEKCTPLVWEECSLENVLTPFNESRQNCSKSTVHWWNDYENSTSEQMYTKMKCEVKEASECTPTVRKDCTDVDYQECRMEPVDVCTERVVKEPFQEKSYRKQCLLKPSDVNTVVHDAIVDEVFI